MPKPFRTQRLVEFADTDMAGIAHFSAFYRWMESAEHEFIRSLGFSVYEKLGEGVALSFPRVHASCDFRAPARCENVLDIEVTIERLGTKSITYASRFSHAGQLIAEGRITCVCCQVPKGGPVESTPIPEPIAAELRPYVVPADGGS